MYEEGAYPRLRDKGHGKARCLAPHSAVANGQPQAHLKFRVFFADALWASEAQKSIARETKKLPPSL